MTAPPEGSARRRPARGPAFSYLVVMLALLVILGLFTFSPPPSSPPAIAEVAPRALEQITEAPIEQAVSPGGSRGNVGAKEPPNLGDNKKELVSEFRCIGVKGTTRQIEDPQSPPCVPVWPRGDNGGATYQGVTRDTITVVAPSTSDGDPVLKAYEDFFNRRFQFYGRKLKLVGFATKNDVSLDGAANQQNLAAEADQIQAFASLPYYPYQGAVYYRELARRKIMAVTDYSQYTQQALEKLKPYVWQYGMALDRIMAMSGDWICHRLAGGLATYTTDPTLLGDRRSFGLITQDAVGNRLDTAPLRQAAARCGVTFAATRHFDHDMTAQDQQTAKPPESESPEMRAAVLEMKQKEITSILCLCHTSVMGSFAQQASKQSYFPEWQVATYLLHETLWVQQTNNPDARHRSSMFGLTFMPHVQRAEDDPAMWALREENPSLFVPNRDDMSSKRQLNYQVLYRPLLLLASGIQMAGPRLTPQTFAAGLHRTTFPNPDTPIKAGKVGFLGGSYSMTIDAAEYWWSNATPAPYVADPPGTWCYVQGGERRQEGNWPGEPAFFQGRCDSGG